MPGLQSSIGPDDQRFVEIDDDFRRALGGFTSWVAAARMSGARVLHRTATTARGSLCLEADLGLPEHGFFASGRRFDVLARYSNGIESDDIAPAGRGVTLRLLDPAGDGHAGQLDLVFIAGNRFFARNADIFYRFSAGGALRRNLVDEIPGFRQRVWDLYRHATSFTEYHYYSQVPTGYTDISGRQWLARYRLIPRNGAPETGHFEPGDLLLPPEPPGELQRDPTDRRSRSYLHDALRAQLLGDTVELLLQVQLHPVVASEAANEAALDCTEIWPADQYPWRDLGAVRLDSVVSNAAIEGLQFSPSLAPPDLGVVLATSPYQNASLNHMRSLVYRLASAARRGEKLPAAFADLMPSAGAASTTTRGLRQQITETTTRTVCVVGAGPAGLSVVRELERAGHRVIVLESRPDIAGKCDSVYIDNHAYDLGGHICSNQYQNVAQLAVELGVPTEETTPYQAYDLATRGFRPPSMAFFQRDLFNRYRALRDEEYPRIGDAGLAHSARALAQPASEWLAEHQLEALAESMDLVYTSSGYGHLTGTMPALYFVKFAEMTGVLSTKPELLGHTGTFTIVGGFKRLWRAVAAELTDLRCGVTITGIRRDPDVSTGGVRVRTDQGDVVADDLVLTVPIDQLTTILDVSPEERDIASRVRTVDYYTTVLSASGLPRSAFYMIDEYNHLPEEPGHIVAFHHRYPERDEYACYSYGAPDLDGDGIVAIARADIERMGGQPGAIHTQRRWKYMPHFGSEDLAAGIYERIEDLQGHRHTYHAGSLPGYEMVECVVAYSRKLVCNHFGGTAADTQLPANTTTGFRTSSSEVPLATESELRTWLVEHIAAELRVPQETIEPDAQLDSFALESVSVAALGSALSDWLGFRTPATLFLDHPTINALARYLATPETPAVPSDSLTAAITTKTTPQLLLSLTPPRPFFCVGGAHGAAYYLIKLAREVGSAHPFYGLRAPGYDGTEPLRTVEELAERFIESIKAIQPYGPYLLGGHSFGGLVAYEMGCRLRAEGEEVTRIVLLDTHLPVPDQPTAPARRSCRDRGIAHDEPALVFVGGGPGRCRD